MESTQMKKIPNQFRKNGFDYRLVKRDVHIAVYKQLEEGEVLGYEVHKIRSRNAVTCKYRNPDGTHRTVAYPKQEILAGNEDFGIYGWYFEKYENAIKKFEELK